MWRKGCLLDFIRQGFFNLRTTWTTCEVNLVDRFGHNSLKFKYLTFYEEFPCVGEALCASRFDDEDSGNFPR